MLELHLRSDSNSISDHILECFNPACRSKNISLKYLVEGEKVIFGLYCTDCLCHAPALATGKEYFEWFSVDHPDHINIALASISEWNNIPRYPTEEHND